jgi:hypothetical protein
MIAPSMVSRLKKTPTTAQLEWRAVPPAQQSGSGNKSNSAIQDQQSAGAGGARERNGKCSQGATTKIALTGRRNPRKNRQFKMATGRDNQVPCARKSQIEQWSCPCNAPPTATTASLLLAPTIVAVELGQSSQARQPTSWQESAGWQQASCPCPGSECKPSPIAETKPCKMAKVQMSRIRQVARITKAAEWEFAAKQALPYLYRRRFGKTSRKDVLVRSSRAKTTSLLRPMPNAIWHVICVCASP